MKVIYKYPLGGFSVVVALPVAAEILTVREQDGCPTLWALVDPPGPNSVIERRRFRLVATGETFEEQGSQFLGTVFMDYGRLVYHLFEVPL
jgi:hypothetical protein